MSAVPAAVACLCGSVTSQQVLVASLVRSPPRSSAISFCHCRDCRSTSGVLCTSYYPLVDLLNAHRLISNPAVREYAQSSQLSRWFCSICGAQVLALLKAQNKYFVAAGLLDPAHLSASEPNCEHEPAVVHWGVAESRDGGVSIFIPGSRCDSTLCLLGSTTEPMLPEPTPAPGHTTSISPVQIEDKNRLHARCHCGGVSFAITRPNSRSKEASSPWPDVIVPFHLASSNNPEDVKWWIRDEDSKWLAGACACRSCRLASGFPIQCWAFVSRANLINSHDKGHVGQHEPADFTYDTGTLQRFESSPGVYREFCSVCGATVFWHCNWRPGVVDVSVGLLNSDAGARAEDWLEWETGRVSFAENAQDKSLIALLGKGLRNPVYS